MSTSNQPTDEQDGVLGVGFGGDRSYLYGNETIQFQHGRRVFTVYLITKKDRLFCPIDRCAHRFESEKGLHKHLTDVHDIPHLHEQTCERNGCKKTFKPYHDKNERFCCEQCAFKARYGSEQCCACGAVIDSSDATILEDTRGANTLQIMCDHCVDDGWLTVKQKTKLSDSTNHC